MIERFKRWLWRKLKAEYLDDDLHFMAQRFEEQLMAAAEEQYAKGGTVDCVDVYVTPFQEVPIRWHFVTREA